MPARKSKSKLPLAQVDSSRTLQAMIVAIVIGEGSLICMPFIVGGIVERYELAEGAAGIVTSLQFATMGLASILILNIVHKIDRRRWLLLGAIFILLGHGLAVLSSSWILFLVGRVITGLGEGTALSIGNASAAGTRRPQKTYSILAITMVVTAGSGLSVHATVGQKNWFCRSLLCVDWTCCISNAFPVRHAQTRAFKRRCIPNKNAQSYGLFPGFSLVSAVFLPVLMCCGRMRSGLVFQSV